MNIMGKPPLGLKDRTRKDAPKLRKPVRKVSKTRARARASTDGQEDLAYMGMVKQLPCAHCGAPPPSDAHHCYHKPNKDEPHGYKRLPTGRTKSHDRDTIPLCKHDHQDGPGAIHKIKRTWLAKHGPDYQHIPATRAAVAAINGTIDF